MKIFYNLIFLIIFFNSSKLIADEPSKWLEIEIDKILISYQNSDLPNENRLNSFRSERLLVINLCAKV